MARKKTEGSVLLRAAVGVGSSPEDLLCPKYLSFTFIGEKSSYPEKQNPFILFSEERRKLQLVALQAVSTRSKFIGFTAKHIWSNLTRTTSNLLPQFTLPQVICLFRRKESS